MKLKHQSQSVRVQHNKQQQRVQRNHEQIEQPGANPVVQQQPLQDYAGNNQSNPSDEVLEPGQQNNQGAAAHHHGSQQSPSNTNSSSSMQQPHQQNHQRGNAINASNQDHLISKGRSKNSNVMQHQNRPIQKGKRIFLEMRDSQISPGNNASQVNNNVKVKQDRSTNQQLKQKVVNSQEDSMVHDSDPEMPSAQAAIYELRQLSARGDRKSKNTLISSSSMGAGLVNNTGSSGNNGNTNGNNVRIAGMGAISHQHNQSQVPVSRSQLNAAINQVEVASEDMSAIFPIKGEGQIKFMQQAAQAHKKRRKTVAELLENDRFHQQPNGNQSVNSAMGQGQRVVQHPGTQRILNQHGSAGSVFISYEKLAKAADQMTKQITVKGELFLKDRGFSIIPEALRFQCHAFEQLLVLDMQNNSITELDGDFCQNFPCLEKLDLRNNKIKSLNPHIKALMSLQVLRLDGNQLTQIVPQIGNLKLLEELSVSNNKLFEIPQCFGENLTQLHTLNVSDNQIKSLPASLGNLGKYNLKCLFLHGNNFTSFPSTFLHMCNLEELSLEWFLYAKPSKPKLVRRCTEDGRNVFESLEQLFNLLVRHSMNECMLIIFLEYYSVEDFEVNHKDNRQRTPLHNASAKGDNGVLEGLLQGNADPNILDKDNCTPLCLAIRDEKFAAAQILIDSEEVDVNMGGGIYGSPLHLAVVKLEIWLIKALIKKGADVNKTDCDGKTALHFVMNLFSKNPQKCQYIAETLVLNGAKPNLKDTDNWTPLHTAVRKGQDKGVAAIAKLNNLLVDKEKFDMNATGGVHKWTALHLAAHGGHLNIVKELLRAGADIFQRNTNNQLPRHCAKGNYILTKFIKMSEQSRTSQAYNSYVIGNQFQLIRGLTMRKPTEFKSQPQIPKKSSTAYEMIQGYNNLVSTLKLVRKHRPFAENDNLPKICQPEDHVEVSSPRSTSSSNDNFSEKDRQQPNDVQDGNKYNDNSPEANEEFESNVDYREERKDTAKIADNFGDQGSAADGISDDEKFDHVTAASMPSTKQPGMGPSCNLQSIDAVAQSKNNKNSKASAGSSNGRDKFNRINALEEERKVNLFYLKDTICNKDASMNEKFEALVQIRKNVNLPVFKFAIESVLTKFHQISERSIQLEVISIIAKSQQPELLSRLQKLLVCNVKNLNSDVADEIDEAICELKASVKYQQKKQHEIQQNQQNSSIANRARNISHQQQQQRPQLHLQQQVVQRQQLIQVNQAPSPHPKSVQPPPIGSGNNQSVLGMSVHSQMETVKQNRQASPGDQQMFNNSNGARKLGHPGAIKDASSLEQSSVHEDTIKRSGNMFEFQKPVVHAGLSSINPISSDYSNSVGPPNHQINNSTVSQPGITRQTIICDTNSPMTQPQNKSKTRGISSSLELSENNFASSSVQNQDQMQAVASNYVVTGSAHYGREKQINPSNKVMSKQNMVQSLVNNMNSSSQQSSGDGRYHEEDVSSSHIEVDKPLMSINPSMTQNVASGKKTKQSSSAVCHEETKGPPATPTSHIGNQQSRRALNPGSGPNLGNERPNHPRISRGTKQGSNVNYSSGNMFIASHPGTQMKSNFTNQVSIGSMSDSLNARFLMKTPKQSTHYNDQGGVNQRQQQHRSKQQQQSQQQQQ